MIQMEFGNGSHTHQTVCRIFDVGGRAIVLQATEYQMLRYLADDDEAMDLLHSCFLQPDFAPMRFTFVQPDLNDDNEYYGFYVNDQNALDNHRWHNFADGQQEQLPHVAGIVPEDEEPAAVFAIPPPPPANEDFAEIYRRNLEIINNDDVAENADDDVDYIDNRYHQGPRRSIIHYIYNDGDSDGDSGDDNDDELPARG
jgi:hypothetical protein